MSIKFFFYFCFLRQYKNHKNIRKLRLMLSICIRFLCIRSGHASVTLACTDHLHKKLMCALIICIRYLSDHIWILKGQCHKIVCFRFFSRIIFPQPLNITIGSFQIFSKIRGDFHNSRCITGINSTSDKFSTGVNENAATSRC